MPDLSFLKPSTDLQFVALIAGIVLLLPRILGKKLKLPSLGGSSDDSKDPDSSGEHECKQEGVLEDILTKLKGIVDDVNTLKAETKAESRLNDERHEMIQGQLTTLAGRFDDMFSILLKLHNKDQ